MSTSDPDLTITRADDPWTAVADSPTAAENLRIRSDLMDAIIDRIDEIGWSQSIAAARLGVSQPRISDLYRGKIDKFSVDALVNLGRPIGVHVSVSIDPRDQLDPEFA